MSIAAEFGTGQVLWSILWFFLFFLWIWLLIAIFSDIMRSSLSGWGKALWTLGIIVLPFLGILLYLIVNGGDMNEREAEQAQAADDATQAYIRQAAGTGAGMADELSKLADLHSAGTISDSEYEQAKSRVVAG
jgi:hypothetical protein